MHFAHCLALGETAFQGPHRGSTLRVVCVRNGRAPPLCWLRASVSSVSECGSPWKCDPPPSYCIGYLRKVVFLRVSVHGALLTHTGIQLLVPSHICPQSMAFREQSHLSRKVQQGFTTQQCKHTTAFTCANISLGLPVPTPYRDCTRLPEMRSQTQLPGLPP